MERSRASWTGIDLSRTPADGPVAFSADTGPDSLLAAYRAGAYPFPTTDDYARTVNEIAYAGEVASGRTWLVGADVADPYTVSWWSPDPRPVLDVGGVHLSRRLARQLRGPAPWVTTLDRDFGQVVRACQAGRDPQWLTDALVDSLAALHRAGWAHSVEVWEGTALVGGVFGVRIGAVISMDSMFHRRPGASTTAVADLADRFAEAGGAVLDAQWDSPHVRAMGATLLPRERYLALLAEQRPGPGAQPDEPPLPTGPRPARRLAEPRSADR
ncbi:leucyl/phenylalanyl-tRNA--protein transferase [Streptacidiphilus sp. PB12-B1b]|uniref:leucyl/phenylalanyl-tRNA--protein transferase n=1 Tax=Streptacidiphilus sp. PB12-B1b TaxID=2705012 RepID=UPI0015F9AD07|nr:leucyl/phenylalanyl-tRNA--protein transferase [Streptacidiphilus sp. PB12-B1b]QMU77157.1 leucyl/phenylalanyl-tRNA--protein transferase [Streptacidiphilus sp. PB12-B1b]